MRTGDTALKDLAVSLEDVRANSAPCDLLDDLVGFLKRVDSEKRLRRAARATPRPCVDGGMYESTTSTPLALRSSRPAIVYGAVAARKQAVHTFRRRESVRGVP
jgi:Macrocin-O-methyltransferase (TylF)